MKEAYDFIVLGGPVMIPIILGSVIALAIFLERLWSLRKKEIIPDELPDKVNEYIEKNNHNEALEYCKKNKTPLSNIYNTIINHKNLDRNELMQVAEDEGRYQVAQMEKYIEALGTIASLEPLLGLLGTVTGLIEAFREVVSLASQGAVDPARLASGIWEALITTVGGLVVAIPAYIGYKYLLSRVSRFSLTMEKESIKLIDKLTEGKKNEISVE